MAFPTSASAPLQQPADLLRLARARVLATVDDPVPTEPGTVISPVPLRELPAGVAAVVAARTAAGRDPLGRDFPRRRWLRAATVAALLTGPALAATVAGLITGHGTLAAMTGITTVVLAVVAVLGARHAAADPLYLGTTERRALAAASSWRPSRAWPPGRKAAVVACAVTTARRLVDAPAWRDGRLAEAGVALPLGAELDRIEQTADDNSAIGRAATLLAYTDVAASLGDIGTPLEAEDVEILCFLLSGAAHDTDPS